MQPQSLNQHGAVADLVLHSDFIKEAGFVPHDRHCFICFIWSNASKHLVSLRGHNVIMLRKNHNSDKKNSLFLNDTKLATIPVTSWFLITSLYITGTFTILQGINQGLLPQHPKIYDTVALKHDVNIL